MLSGKTEEEENISLNRIVESQRNKYREEDFKVIDTKTSAEIFLDNGFLICDEKTQMPFCYIYSKRSPNSRDGIYFFKEFKTKIDKNKTKIDKRIESVQFWSGGMADAFCNALGKDKEKLKK